MAVEFTYRGKTLTELQRLALKKFAKLVPARQRRSILRNSLDRYKRFMVKVREAKRGERKKPIKTQGRDLIVIPEMVGALIQIHNGKEYVAREITEEMLGLYLGELAQTRKKVEHSAPGIGATKSSTAVATKAK